ncbi:hypothetical protein [Camelimonas lactis]|uniref:Entry exclusion lipoprotein TrbK n=1 Tax=Camelimonas lactis TaxID=659006 RepID=A0A4R2GM06_9HYPH|nr:hypothetical protein [Camelimonas lactis]TCO10136.1 hypothetical protein EV666_1158 [Camelimonas lactis]
MKLDKRRAVVAARMAGALAIAGPALLLGACQTRVPETRAQQLARICADPASLRPDSFYFGECVAYKNPTADQRRKIYMNTAPES